MIDLKDQGVFADTVGRSEVATQDPAESLAMRQSMGEALELAEEITPEIVSEYVEQCNAEGSTNDPDICAMAEKLSVKMAGSCVSGTPSYDASDLHSILQEKDLSVFVPDANGLISKGNFICAKVLLEGIDPETAAMGMSIAELEAPTMPEVLMQAGGGGCPSPT